MGIFAVHLDDLTLLHLDDLTLLTVKSIRTKESPKHKATLS